MKQWDAVTILAKGKGNDLVARMGPRQIEVSMDDVFEDLGTDGWELVSMTGDVSSGIYLFAFKRRRPET
jgi:hypothetical protein